MAAVRKSKARAPSVSGGASRADEETLTFVNAAAWHAWLAAHHSKKRGVLLRLAKGETKTFTYDDAVEAALAWGWIDGQKRALDAAAWVQRFTPRTAKSPWSKINRAKAEALITAKKMMPSGLVEVERARSDGRWDAAYDSARTSTVPDDLARALALNPRAARFFAELDGANRYAILWRVQTAKKPETRAERIARFVGMCARGEKLHEPRARTRPPATKTAKKKTR
ncbi:MAG TPA: YdeI/OmpD-associated family protein [Polyangiaceae bacterium]|jgi:uncharacterized protein YdeI (YjbR/CyaY-like superfamily)|nr:YdeI/OmpD-associated family protein [Polyangiaceae bacterium]